MSSKEYFDYTMNQILYFTPTIKLKRLSEDEKLHVLTSKKVKRGHGFNINEEESPTPKLQIMKPDNEKRDALKLVLKREGKTDKFKSQFKSTAVKRKRKKVVESTLQTSSNSDQSIIEEIQCTENEKEMMESALQLSNNSDESMNEIQCTENMEDLANKINEKKIVESALQTISNFDESTNEIQCTKNNRENLANKVNEKEIIKSALQTSGNFDESLNEIQCTENVEELANKINEKRIVESALQTSNINFDESMNEIQCIKNREDLDNKINEKEIIEFTLQTSSNSVESIIEENQSTENRKELANKINEKEIIESALQTSSINSDESLYEIQYTKNIEELANKSDDDKFKENVLSRTLDNTTKSKNPTNNKIRAHFKLRSMEYLLKENFPNISNENILNEKNTPDVTRIKKMKVVEKKEPSSSNLKSQKKELSMNEIERLYEKYFNKRALDLIYIVAFILHLIALTNKHHKTRMDGSFRMRNAAAKLKERYYANRLYGKNVKVLELTLKQFFEEIVTSFSDEDFYYSFQLFFLGILNVIKLVDKSKPKSISYFKDSQLLLWNSLNRINFNDSRVFSMFKSGSFRRGCIDITTMIEDCDHVDPSIKTRMSAFFSLPNSCNYFEAVIDAINNNSEDFQKILNDEIIKMLLRSTPQFCRNSSVPVPEELINCPPIVPEKTPVNCDKPSKLCVITKNPEKTYQFVSSSNDSKPTQITTNVENVTSSQPINVVTTNVSSTLAPNIFETGTTIMPNLFTVVPKTDASCSSVTPVVYTMIKPFNNIQSQNPPSIQRAPIDKPNDIRVETKTQPELVNVNSPRMESISRQCHRSSCTTNASIMCGSCLRVMYCSDTCQSMDWYGSHSRDCAKNVKQETQTVRNNKPLIKSKNK